jgi:hypothetical protein
MRFIENKGKTFIFEIKDNRLGAANEQEREKGHFKRIDRMEISDEEPVSVYIKDLKFPVILINKCSRTRTVRQGFGIW